MGGLWDSCDTGYDKDTPPWRTPSVECGAAASVPFNACAQMGVNWASQNVQWPEFRTRGTVMGNVFTACPPRGRGVPSTRAMPHEGPGAPFLSVFQALCALRSLAR